MNVLKNRIIWTGFLGNIVETYDLIVYGLMAHYIALHFFSVDNKNSLLYTFYILFFGYLARPIGAMIFGFISDHHGRKKAIAFSTLLTGLSTALIGLLPSYQSIGVFATYLLLLLRLIQGIASGGEYTNSIVFLVEHGYQKRRGFMGSWATNGNCAGFLFASIIGTASIYLFSHHTLPEWGWRCPFLIAFIGAAFIFWMQYTSRETLPFIVANSTENPQYFRSYLSTLLKTLSAEKKKYLLISAVLWLSVSFTYLIFIYGPVHITQNNHIPFYRALEINAASLLLLLVLTPCFGYWSDRYGRKPFLTAATVIFLILAYPFFLLTSQGSFSAILAMQLFLAIPAAAFYGILPVLMVEIMPTKIRGMMSGLLYNIVASIIGGSAPVIALTLIRYTHNPASPAYYLIFSAVIALIALTQLKESSMERKDTMSLLTE